MLQVRSITHGLVVLLLGILLAGTAFAAPPVDIRAVRLWRAPDNTRLVFDLSGPVEHRTFTLQDPERLVIDISNARLKADTRSLHLEGTPIREVRAAAKDASDLRVVLNLSAHVRPNSFTLKPNATYGNRLVIDLYDTVVPGGEPSPDMPPEPVAAAPAPAAVKPPAPAAVPAPTPAPVPAPAITQAPGPAPVPAPAPVAPAPAPAVTAVPPAARPAPAITKTVDDSKVGKRDIVIAIDAGHGGEDPGATGPRGIQEKDIVLAISREVEKLFQDEKGYKPVLVRKGDYYIPLDRRRDIARQHRADFFVAIHADAFTDRAARGGSVFAVSERGATSAMGRFLAEKENAADLVGGVPLADKDQQVRQLLLDLSMTQTLNSSLNAGALVLKQMDHIGELHSNKVEQAAFAVLKNPDIPSLLVETGFISNPEESRLLNSQAYREKMAKAIFDGINNHFRSHPPDGSYLAWKLKNKGDDKQTSAEPKAAPRLDALQESPATAAHGKRAS